MLFPAVFVSSMWLNRTSQSRTQSIIDFFVGLAVQLSFGFDTCTLEGATPSIFRLEIREFLFLVWGFSSYYAVNLFIYLQHAQELHLTISLLHDLFVPSFQHRLWIQSTLDPCKSFELWADGERLPVFWDATKSNVSHFWLLQNIWSPNIFSRIVQYCSSWQYAQAFGPG